MHTYNIPRMCVRYVRASVPYNGHCFIRCSARCCDAHRSKKKKETYRHFHSINFAPVKGARVFVTLCISKKKHIVQERERERERERKSHVPSLIKPAICFERIKVYRIGYGQIRIMAYWRERGFISRLNGLRFTRGILGNFPRSERWT